MKGQMTRLLLILVVLILAAPASAAKPTGPSCSTTATTLAYPDRTGWHMTATVPARANVAVVVTGAGAPSNEWSNVRWAYKQGPVGIIDDAYITTLFTSSGTATVQLVDVAADGTFTPIISCSLEVTAQ